MDIFGDMAQFFNPRDFFAYIIAGFVSFIVFQTVRKWGV